MAVPLAGVALLSAMFLAPALWNRFPLFFYDTGGYLAQGLGGVFLAERAPVYSLLLFVTAGGFSLWPVVLLQAAMTAFIIMELARAEVPGLTLWGLGLIGIVLTIVTGIAWYAGQVEPDCMTPLLIGGCYLLMFRRAGMGRIRRILVFAITALAIACHPSHLGLMAGLLIAGALLKALLLFLPLRPSLAVGRAKGPPDLSLIRPPGPATASGSLGREPDPTASASRAGEAGLSALNPQLARPFFAFLLAIALILAGNFGLARGVFISRTGSVFVFARLMQDGIVKRLLDETCPGSGYKLCEYRHKLKTRVDAWLWGSDSGFHALGGFSGREQQQEDTRIILDSLKRYPMMNLRAAIYDSALQFLLFKTGDGIEPQENILAPGLEQLIPRQMPAYLAARQQKGLLRFRALNLLHVPVGVLGVLGLILLLNHAAVRRRWDDAPLPALVLLALIGNAIICGTFAEPHDRYQSRVIWLPVLVLLLARMRDPHALQPVPESVT